MTASALLTGFGAADPGVSFQPGSLRFLNVPGTESTQQSITIANTGSLRATIGTPTASDPHFSATSTCSTLGVGASCAVTVTYMPTLALSAGLLTLPVTTAPGGAAQTTNYTLALAGLYTAENAGIQIVPGETEAIHFGSVVTGTVGGVRVLHVNNLTGKSLAVAVEAPRQFPIVGSTCGGLAPYASCDLTVTYAPLTDADVTGTVFVQATPTDGSPTLDGLGYLEGYGLSGNTIAASGNLSPTGVLDLGQVGSGQSSSQTITLTNRGAVTGSSVVTIRRIRSEPPFLSTTTCGSSLALGASCTVTVTYAPVYQTPAGGGAVGAQSDTGVVTVEADAENAPLFLEVAGRAAPVQTASPSNNGPIAAIATSQGALTFGNTAVGTASASQSFTVANIGNVPIHITGLLASPDFTATGNCGTLATGASCTVSVSFTPRFAGTRSGALEIQSDSAASLEFVSLLGSSTPASVSLSPESLDFGSVLTGNSTTQTATFTNTGSTPAVLGSLSVTGDYTLATASSSGNLCTSGASIAGGASCTISVLFTPSRIGGRVGTLSVPNSATPLPLTATLSGIGVQPQLTVVPNGLSFGDVLTGKSAQLSLTLSNGSSIAVSGLSFAVNGDYTVASSCGPVTLNAGSSCSVTVTFSPTQTGTRAGTLTITSSDPASPVRVPLTGNGIQGGSLVQGGSFLLTVNGGATGSAVVQFGIPAKYALTLTPVKGFSGIVALTCAAQGPAQYTSCSLLPATVTLANGVQTSTAVINTLTAVPVTAQLDSLRRRNVLAACLLAPAFLLLLRRRTLRLPALALLSCVLLLANGCGSGVGDKRIRYAAPGTYQYSVTASSTTGVPVSQTVTLNLTITQ